MCVCLFECFLLFCRLALLLLNALEEELCLQCKLVLLSTKQVTVVKWYFRKKWMAVVGLQGTEKVNEAKTLRKLARLNKYDIKAVLWNPHMAMHQLVVSTVTRAMLMHTRGGFIPRPNAVSAEIGRLGC